MIVTTPVTAKQLRNVSSYIADYVFCEYGRTIPECAGVVEKELIEAIESSPYFAKIVQYRTQRFGTMFLDEPMEFMGDAALTEFPEAKRLLQRLDEMRVIVESIE